MSNGCARGNASLCTQVNNLILRNIFCTHPARLKILAAEWRRCC